LPDSPPAVVAILGPTGVGKTATAIALADRIRERGGDAVAIGSDALQVYEGLATLTGAATAEERERLEHRLVGFVPVTQKFDVGQYMPLAHAEIDSALEANRTPIVVGGTGLYMRAALAELSLKPAAEGEESELWSTDTRHPTLVVGLNMDREQLYERVEQRVDEIVARGGRGEAESAEAAGASHTARKALGFDELLAGDLDAMRKRSRNYARRQLTWMRKVPGLYEIDVTGREATDVAAEIDRLLTDG
jgi:tRNA dimethylallyltransferase